MIVLVALGRRCLALKRKGWAVHVRRRGRRSGGRVAERGEGRAIGALCRGRGCRMGGGGAIDVLGDVECGVGRVVWGRVVLGGVVLEIEALEGGKAKVAVGHVRLLMGM